MVRRKRKQRQHTFDDTIYQDFKRYCRNNEKVMSREIERMMKKRLRRRF